MRRTSAPGKKLSTLPRIESSTVGLDSIEAAADAEHRAAARREMPGGPAWREAAERASAGGSCELALIERGLDDADVIALVASLQREAAGSALTGSRPINNVTSLDLRGNAIGDAGAAALSGLLRGEGCAICTLRLWGNRIGDEGERDTSPAAPNRCMSHCVAGSGSRACGTSDSTLPSLCDCLFCRVLSRVSELPLLPSSPGGAALVSALARPNSSLTSLDLGKQGQPVGDAVAAALASSLPRCACRCSRETSPTACRVSTHSGPAQVRARCRRSTFATAA